MSTASIWTSDGVLPPRDENDPVSPDRSPYYCLMGDVVSVFATSADRIKILRGFLRYREELHALGMTVGQQWINGSFCEDCETTRARSPNDIDVVTFFDLPTGVTIGDLKNQKPDLFPADLAAHQAVKAAYSVDGYFVGRGQPPEALVSLTTYWYSLFAHRRDDGLWKGFLAVDLEPSGDAAAAVELQAIATALGVKP